MVASTSRSVVSALYLTLDGIIGASDLEVVLLMNERRYRPLRASQLHPGTAQVYTYPKCDGGKIVADVSRMDKAHTEGLEPKVTEARIKMIVLAPGGKANN